MYDLTLIWIWLLSIPVFTMVAKSWYPWCCCDLVDPPPCSSCTADSETISVTIAGATDDACTYCDENVNGTFVLRRLPYSTCGWAFVDYNMVCKYVYPSFLKVTFSIGLVAGTLPPSSNKGWHMRISLTTNWTYPSAYEDVATYRWNSGGTSAFDCTATRTLTNYTYVPDPSYVQLCSNMDALTVTVNP